MKLILNMQRIVKSKIINKKVLADEGFPKETMNDKAVYIV